MFLFNSTPKNPEKHENLENFLNLLSLMYDSDSTTPNSQLGFLLHKIGTDLQRKRLSVSYPRKRLSPSDRLFPRIHLHGKVFTD
jgi:hypothetical protein